MLTPSQILDTYGKLKLQQANEAATRLKVINHVLFDILGWTSADVDPEERVSEDGTTTWADYVIRTGMTAMVIEAKKVGVAFSSIPDARRAPLRAKLMSGATGEAIRQARDYARKLSIPFAVVTNGNAWIVFPATRIDGVSFSDSSAIIFPSLKSALQDDYAEFVDLLSRKAIISGSLQNELLGRIENQLTDRRLNRFFTTSFSKISRHSLFPLIEDAIITAFTEDIVNSDAELLEKCYVQTPERIKFDERIKLQIGKREHVVAKAAQRPVRPGGGRLIGDIVSRAAGRALPLAILVLGQVGAGKTTFLAHSRQVSAKEIFEPAQDKPYPHWIYVDFRSFSPSDSALRFLADKLKDFISSDPFLSDFERCIRHAYKAEIDALFKGPLFLLSADEGERKRRVSDLLMEDYNKTYPYVEKILTYAAANAPTFLVVDNMDQHDDEKTQALIFSEAMALAQRTRMNLICSMREATFVRHRGTPIFDAFDFDPIAIDPPNILAVLSKRFFVARQLLEGRSGRFTAENGAEVKVESLSTIIELVQASVLGTNLGGLIEVLATSDVRLALRMTREFLRSGWTASGKAYQIYKATGKYVMPQHEALRAIMLGSQQVYSEELSVLGNVFDSKLSSTEAQHLRLYVLSSIVMLSSARSFRHLEGKQIFDALRELGFGDALIMRVLEDLCALRFIHTVSHSAPAIESNYIVSRLGGYIVRHFIADFTYLENVMMDTFIADQKVWDELRSLTAGIYAERNVVSRVKIRKRRVECFFGYMKEVYEPLRAESARRGLAAEWCVNPLEAIEGQFKSNLNRVQRSAERNYRA